MKKKKILAVEYDNNLGEIYKKDFGAQEGLEVEVTPNSVGKPMDEVHAILKSKPDILLIYIRPEGEGFTVLEELHRKKKMPYTIVLSYDAREETKQKCLKLGANEFFLKSEVTMNTLWKSIAQKLGFSPTMPWRKPDVPLASHDSKGVTMEIPIEMIDLPDAVKNASKEDLEADKPYPPFFAENVDYATVLKALEEVLKLLPDDPVLLGKKGNCLEALRLYDEALKVYEQSLSKYPKFLPNMYNKAFCLERLGRNEECNACFDEILKRYPYEVKALANKAKILKRLKRWSEAQDYCNRALLLDSSDFTARYNDEEIQKYLHGDTKSKKSGIAGGTEIGNNMTRLMALGSALKEKPNDPKLLGLKGNFLEALGDHKQALEAYEEALKHAPSDIPNLYNKAFCLARMKRYKECIACCEAIMKIAEHDSRADALKGEILKRMNRLQEALNWSYMALYNDPSQPMAQNNIDEINAILDGRKKNIYSSKLTFSFLSRLF